MNHFDSHLTVASAAVASVAAAAVMSFPMDFSLLGARSVQTSALGCEWVAHTAASVAPAGGAAVLRLVNQSPHTLPAGQRYHWTTLGTPAPVGASGVLPTDLAPGESLALTSGPAVHSAVHSATHAAGCAASTLR